MIHIVVHGAAAPAGSKRGFVHPKTNRVIITDASKRSRPWKALVTDAAIEAMDGRPPLGGPLWVEIGIQVMRPKSHHGKRGLLPSAPEWPTVKPDLLKLARGVEDALTGVVYNDDSQIVDERIRKTYGPSALCDIFVYNEAPSKPLGLKT